MDGELTAQAIETTAQDVTNSSQNVINALNNFQFVVGLNAFLVVANTFLLGNIALLNLQLAEAQTNLLDCQDAQAGTQRATESDFAEEIV